MTGPHRTPLIQRIVIDREVYGVQTPHRGIVHHVEAPALVLMMKDDVLSAALSADPLASALAALRCGDISNRGFRLWLDAR